jgi:hypothetical protein
MDRREFVGVTAAAAASTLTTPGVADAQTRPGETTLSVSATLMQDFVHGYPWILRDGLQGFDQAYVAPDGSPQILSIPYNIEHAIYRMHPAQDAVTPWTFDRTDLPPDSPNGPSNMLPQIVVAPGSSPHLMIHRSHSVQSAPLAPDGSIGAFRVTPRGIHRPLTTGRLAPDCGYILELPDQQSRRQETDTTIYRPLLRDVANPASTFTVSSLPITLTTARVPRAWPLSSGRDDFYRCIIVDDIGDVHSVLLVKQQQRFDLARHDLLGNSKSRNIHVHEPSPSRVQVIFFDLPEIRTISGTFTPLQPQPVTWQPATSSTVPANLGSVASLRVLAAFNPETQAIDAYFSAQRDASGIAYPDLYYTQRTPDGKWQPVKLIEPGAQPLAILPDGRLCLNRKGTGYEIWHRKPTGDFDIEHVLLHRANERVHETSCYRIGLRFLQGGKPLAGEKVGITASVPTLATVSGEHTSLRRLHEETGVADDTGTLWLSLFTPDRMSFPTIYFTSARFNNRLSFDLNEKIHAKFASMSARDLSTAVDPTDNTSVLGKPLSAAGIDQVTTAMRTVAGAAPRPAASAAAPLRLVKTDLTPYWLARADPSFVQPPLAMTPIAPLAFAPLNDGARVSSVDRGAAQRAVDAQAELERSQHHKGFFDQLVDLAVSAWDWMKRVASAGLDYLGDIGSAIKAGLAKVANVIYDGVKLTLTLAIDALVFVYEAAMDTYARVMDALSYIMDMVGVVIGKITRWILDLFFDWGAILRKRDEVRTLLTSGARSITKSWPDPASAAASFAGKLDAVPAALRSLVGASSTRAAVSSPFGGLSVPGNVPATQVTWLLEKVQSFLPHSDLSLAGMNGLSPGPQFVTRFVAVTEALGPSLNDLNGVFDAVLSGRAVSGDFFAVVVDPLIAQVEKIIAAIKEIVLAFGDMIHDVWENPDSIVKWLDTPLPLPGIRTFYKELFDNDLSFFDLISAIGAIALVAAGKKNESLLAESVAPVLPLGRRRFLLAKPDQSQLAPAAQPRPLPIGTPAPTALQKGARTAGLVFAGLQVPTTTVDALFSAQSRPGEKLGMITTGINVSMSVAFEVCCLLQGGEYNYMFGGGLIAVAGMALYFEPLLAPYRSRVLALVPALQLGYHLYVAVDTGSDLKKHDMAFLNAILSGVQNAMALMMRYRKGEITGASRPLAPTEALTYAIVQGALAEAKFSRLLAAAL